MRAIGLGAAVAVVVGDILRRRTGPRAWRPRARALPPSAPRWLAAAALVPAALVVPGLPPVCVVAWWAHRRLRAQRDRRTRAVAVRRALPEVVELLALASTAGLTLPMAHPLVARHAPPPLGPALGAAEAATAAGRPRADALLEHLAPLGERAHAVTDVLVDHLRYGIPLLPALERASLELRLERHRAAEIEARRVPVRLLAPLVACVLPAFALLTVVPLLAASLDALPT